MGELESVPEGGKVVAGISEHDRIIFLLDNVPVGIHICLAGIINHIDITPSVHKPDPSWHLRPRQRKAFSQH